MQSWIKSGWILTFGIWYDGWVCFFFVNEHKIVLLSFYFDSYGAGGQATEYTDESNDRNDTSVNEHDSLFHESKFNEKVKCVDSQR